MAKIAVELKDALARRAVEGAPGQTNVRVLARGDGWKVEDVICTSGPQDRPFEEQHAGVTIAIVAAGSFQYRGAIRHSRGYELMTPGSLVLGNAGQCFECGHEHGAGDRCISFWYAPDFFERLASNAGARARGLDFRMLRLPPLRHMSSLIARAYAGLAASSQTLINVAWEELSAQLAVQTFQLAAGLLPQPNSAPPAAVARVTRSLRMIENHPEASLTLAKLAREARLSPYHFLRTFESLTGVTPHRYILRARLREAAMRLAVEPTRILDIALDCGFGDVSNFNHAFRAEFNVSPRAYRRLK
ncbi:MAG TPA: AraC family transcriptional regulator [Blastocatellia bacterium]|nr:AraC family transcriptional regulator [Blastocatellia bacterium]